MKIKAFCLIVAVFASCQYGWSQESAFSPGEKLTFELRWSFIKAGEATLEVHPVTMINGEKAFHFVMTARTTSFIDHIYKVRDRIDAYADINMTRSIFYRKKQREGSRQRDEVIQFNWNKNEVQYSNFGEPRDPIPVSAGAFDPLSAFYFIRTLDMEKNRMIQRPVTDGKKCVTGIVKITGRETITVNEKDYDTYVLEPDLKHVKGVFEKSRDAEMTIWITADRRKIPVRITSKVIIGSFIGELVSTQGLAH